MPKAPVSDDWKPFQSLRVALRATLGEKFAQKNGTPVNPPKSSLTAVAAIQKAEVGDNCASGIRC